MGEKRNYFGNLKTEMYKQRCIKFPNKWGGGVISKRQDKTIIKILLNNWGRKSKREEKEWGKISNLLKLHTHLC